MAVKPPCGASIQDGRGTSVGSRQRIVVVDGLSETEEVLKAILEPRGLQVTRIRTHDSVARFRETEPPHVVVVHGSAADVDEPSVGIWNSIPRVVIGFAHDAPTQVSERRTSTYFLNKPFHYAELIRAIERLLPQFV